MYKPCRYLFCLISFFFLFLGCKSKTVESDAMPYSPYVEAFTSGKISRYAPVYLIFSEEVAPEKMQNAELSKYFKIKPEIKGEFSFDNNKTIIFKPSEPMNRDTEYTVTVDMSGWFEATGETKYFVFKYSTLPLALRVERQSIDINADNETGYDINYSLNTPDKETAETVEALVKFSEKVDMEWQHNADEKSHQLIVKNIKAGTEGSRLLTLSIASNKLGVKEETLISTNIPGINDFSVYEVKYVSEPERYVEVTFTDPLDSNQNMEGLAYITDNQNETVTVEGNKLRLYPDNKRVGKQTIHLNAAIRAKNGRTLGDNVEEEIEIINALPGVKFIGNGSIIPLTTELNVPFQAVYLRGVIVRVIKIMEQNVGQYLQTNNIGNTNNLMQVGRLVARKTIFLDEEGGSLLDWKTYALKLNDLIEPEPGAIYRIEFSFTRDLSVYPCDTDTKKTKEQILSEDDLKFKEELNKFDNGGYYYYYGETEYDDYNYYDRENPCSNSYFYNKVVGKNILATNLGLMAMMGQDKEMTVLVHNISTTFPERGVNVTLHNFQHQIIGSGTTDDKGQVKVKLEQGRPFYMIAAQGKQRSYMRIDQGSSLSLSSFDVSGEVVQKGIKGFIYGDRGVWRPGDTLYLSFMLKDPLKTLPASHPVVMELFTPLGQSYLRKTQTNGELGLYAFPMPTESDAPTGAWNVKVQVGGVTFEKSIRIETIKPNRLKIDLKLPEKPVVKGEAFQIPLHTEWMQGAVARNLKYDMQASFTPTKTTFDKYKDYIFDDPTKIFEGEESTLIEGKTNEVGDATANIRFEVGTSAPGMLIAGLTTRVYEESGDFSIDGANFMYSPYKRYVGIKSPQKDKVQLVTDKDHTFEVMTVDHQGNPTSANLEVKVYRVSWYWWWNSSNQQLANYISDSYYSPREEIDIKTGADGKGSFKLNMEYGNWGTYLIRVHDKNGDHSTGMLSYFDWPDYGELRRRDAGSSSPTELKFNTDKEEYKPGEKVAVTFPSPAGSRAIVSIENGTKVLAITEHLCESGETTIKLDVTKEMQPNAYVHIRLLQPHGNTTNDLPIRLYGVMPFKVSDPESYLHPVISTTDEFKPEENYTITVSEQQGRPMAYTLAIVDEGLLDLTRFVTPDPWKAFNAREALGVTSWDMYNYILGAYGGRIEQLFSIGGDDALNKAPKATVNRFKPVVRFEGPFLLQKGEKKRHTNLMPNYNGRVRVMVVAGDGAAYGHTDKSVFVRKPVMLLGTLPRIIGVGEEMAVPATVFATVDNIGDVKVSITCSDNMEVVGSNTLTLNFTQKEDKQASFRIKVKDKPGAGKVIITAVGKGEKATYETDIEIRSVRRPQTNVQSLTIEPGRSWKETVSMPGVDGTNSLMVEMSDVPPLNLGYRLNFLLGYPHGCLEQITSKAFPQLYLKEFASLTQKQEKSIEDGVKSVLSRYRSYQMPDGGFAYWSGGNYINPWGTIYATHFMIEAGSKGYMVNQNMRRNALNFIKKTTRNWKSTSDKYYYSSSISTQAYSLYVLALAQQPELGAMNRLKELKELNDVSRWMLAASYALVGREDVANQLLTQTTDVKTDYNSYDYTYGSSFRDLGINLQTLSLLKKGSEAAKLTKQISDVLSSDRWLSTQETSYALIGLSSYMSRYKVSESMNFSYSCNGKSETVGTTKNIWTETLLEEAAPTSTLELKNEGKSTLFARVITEGVPEQGEEKAHANGVAMDVSYLDANGRPVKVEQLPQGTNFQAVVTVKNPTNYPIQNLALTQIFPAGWEILNTRFLHEEGNEPAETDGISYQDIRDDRIYSYIDNLRANRQVTIRINLTSVYSGTFYLPPTYCEAMYDNLIQANTVGKMVVVE